MVKVRLPATFDNIPSDEVMAGKYFLDIMNDGSKEMKDSVREILKAIWLRLAHPDAVESSDADLGVAVGNYYRRMARADMQKVAPMAIEDQTT